MRRVELAITFRDEDGAERTESHGVETSYMADAAGEHRVAHILATELKVTVGEQAAPKHNALARGWMEFPNRPADFGQYFDIQNSQALWFELGNLVMGAEGDLALAQAFKALEPGDETSFDDGVAINDLYYIHDRKMMLLNQSVHALIMVQDLVNRLLHESLGGDLVNTSAPDWERTQLFRVNVIKGLEAKRADGGISEAVYDAIKDALEIPTNTPKGEIAKTYRNRLMHHVRPSVDYAMFFSALESRVGEEIRDAEGKIIGRRHALLARPPVQYRFEELHPAFSEYLDALVAMLQRLSEIEILRR
jgi:hypothetical protein